MRALIVYESRRGFTMRVAAAIRDELRARGEQASCATFATLDAGTLAAADVLVVGTWIQGLLLVKVGPADGAMRGIAGLPDLGGRPAAVFCTFDVNPFDSLNRMAARLQSRGARILPIAGRFPRRKKLARVPDFVDRLLESMRAPVGEHGRAR